MNAELMKALEQLLDRPKKKRDRSSTTEQKTPRNESYLLSAIAAAGSLTGTEVNLGGYVLRLSSSSHASAKLEVCFDSTPTRSSSWHPIVPSGSVRPPHGERFESFRARRQTGTPSSANTARFVVDTAEEGVSIDEAPQAGNVTAGGRTQVQVSITDISGNETDVVGSTQGAIAISGWDGAAYTRVLVDTSGRQMIVGAAASGAALAGNPVLTAWQNIGGTVAVPHLGVPGSSYTGSPNVVMTGGRDGSNNVQLFLVDTSGRSVIVGAAASGSAVAGNPVLIAGKDGSSTTRSIATDSAGNVYVAGDDNAGASHRLNVTNHGSATGATPSVLLIGGADGTNARALLTDTSGRQIAVGAAADAAAAAGNPLLIAGTFSTNVKTLICVASNSTTTVDGAAGNSRLSVQSQASTTIVTLWSAAAVGIGGTSASFPIYGHRRVEIFGNTSVATTLSVQFSQDAATWFDATSGTAAGQTPSVAANGNFSLSFDTGAPYCRLKSSAAATITALGGAKA